MAGKVLKGACGVVLAGGEGRRLGGRKEELRLGGAPGVRLIESVLSVLDECFPRVIVVGRRPGEVELPPEIEAVPDEFPGSGPLGGIATGLGAMGEEWGFFCGCDMPCLSAEFIRELWRKARASGGGAVVPRVGEEIEPLHAFYSSACRDAAVEFVLRGERAPRKLFDRVQAVHVDVEPGSRSALSFTNINTPADLRRFLSGTRKAASDLSPRPLVPPLGSRDLGVEGRPRSSGSEGRRGDTEEETEGPGEA